MERGIFYKYNPTARYLALPNLFTKSGSAFIPMALIPIRHILIALGVFARVVFSPLRNLYLNGCLLFIHIRDARMPIQTEKSRSLSVASNGAGCPYEYILGVYGRRHFENIVNNLDPDLQTRDPVLFALTLEIMDAIHFGAILVDDIADNSMLRKGKPAAHLLFGSSETINRACLRIFEVIGRCVKKRPSLVPFILESLNQIHKGTTLLCWSLCWICWPKPNKGQDISLVWRRDGFELCLDQSKALSIYKECASLKIGALFRLVGQLVFGSHKKDEAMSQFGSVFWCTQKECALNVR